MTLGIHELALGFGERILLNHVSLHLNIGVRYGLVGANGSGKSTLFKAIAGELTTLHGTINVPKELRLGTLQQETAEFENETLQDLVIQGNKDLWEALQKKNDLLKNEKFGESESAELAYLEEIIHLHQGYSAESRAQALLEGMGVPSERHQSPLSEFSGGYKLRVMLARLLFGDPDILLLDEPSNHLDIVSMRWLEEYLQRFKGLLIITSHDRDFLNTVCNAILDVDFGTVTLYKGNYDAFLKAKEAKREQQEKLLDKQEKRKDEMEAFITRFKAKASKARQAMSRQRLVDKLEDEIEGQALVPTSRQYPNFKFSQGRPSGVTPLKIHEICKSFDEKQVLKNVSLEIERGERIAIIGRNGIGKSTLLKIIHQEVLPDSGEFKFGPSVTTSYCPQDRALLFHSPVSLIDWLNQRLEFKSSTQELRDLLGKVLFSGKTVDRSVTTLSGGEMARLLFSGMMGEGANFLFFDEPTNHLDMEAIESLVSALKGYEGTLVFVSHNSYFVNQLATRIVALQDDGLIDYQGNYQDFVAKYEQDHLCKKEAFSEERKKQSDQDGAQRYAEKKLLRSEKSKQERRIKKLEEQISEIEKQIEEIDVVFASEGYYQTTPQDEIQMLLNKKEEAEEKLSELFEEWESLI